VPGVQDHLTFFPDAEHVAQPAQFGLRSEDVWLPVDGESIHGWYLTPEPGREIRGYLLFSHGNAGNISGRLPLADSLVGLDLAVLLYDYRGYGLSEGEPTVSGIFEDAEVALAWLTQRAGDPSKVVLLGRSLGGGVTWELADRHPDLGGVITDCTFTSVPALTRAMFPLNLLNPAIQNRMNNLRKVARAAPPKLLLHGTEDEVIPFTMGEELASQAREPVTFVPIEGAGHSDTYSVDPERYFGAIDEFIKTAIPK